MREASRRWIGGNASFFAARTRPLPLWGGIGRVNPGVESNRQIERLFLLDIGALQIGDVITNDRRRVA